jgi:hypothetical protein
MRSLFLVGSLILTLAVPSCVDSDDTESEGSNDFDFELEDSHNFGLEEDDAEFDDNNEIDTFSEGDEAPNFPPTPSVPKLQGDPKILATFALYGNLPNTKKNRRHPEQRVVKLPKAVNPEEVDLKWVSINTLGKDPVYGTRFSILRHKSGKAYWWNRPGLDYWIYDDISPRHKPLRREKHFLNMAITDGGMGGPGFIYMGSVDDRFRDLNLFQFPVGTNVFYEVYTGRAYATYFENHSSSVIKHPMFDITTLSQNGDCKKAIRKVSSFPSWQSVETQMRESLTYRYREHGIKVLYVGFYAGCHIDSDHIMKLREALDTLQDELNSLH